MPFIKIEIDDGDFPTKRDMNESLKTSYAEIGRWHQRERIKLHFDANAQQRYKYSKRTRGYEIRKRREKGHNLPLVWTGASARLARTGRVSATRKGVTISIPAPTLNLPKGGPKSKSIGVKKTMSMEVTTVNKNEVDEATKIGLRRLRLRMDVVRLRRKHIRKL